MKIVYLASARDDLIWLRRYYEEVFPEGYSKAQAQYRANKQLLRENPFIGHKTHHEGVRELSIHRTPFSIIYRVGTDQIEILRIWDERRHRN